jgi:hypothetical protein
VPEPSGFIVFGLVGVAMLFRKPPGLKRA